MPASHVGSMVTVPREDGKLSAQCSSNRSGIESQKYKWTDLAIVLGAALRVDRANAMFGIIIRRMIALLMRIILRARARLVSDCLLSLFSLHIWYADRV